MRHNEEVFDFAECEKFGSFGERIVRTALSSRDDWGIEERAATAVEQKSLGIDCVATYAGNRGTLEVKTDMRAALTDNIALETHHEHLNGHHSDGWMRSTTAALLAVLIMRKTDIVPLMDGGEMNRTGSMMVLAVPALREEFEVWRQRYAPKRARNKTKLTWFVPVPRRVVLDSSALVVSYAVTCRHERGKLVAETELWPVRNADLFAAGRR